MHRYVIEKRVPVLKVNLSYFENERTEFKTSLLDLDLFSSQWRTCQHQSCLSTLKSFQCSYHDCQGNVVIKF